MRKFCDGIVKARYVLYGVFAALLVGSLLLLPKVHANYDITRYLPDNMETRQALTVLEDEFGLSGTVNVMIKGVSADEAAALAKRFKIKYVQMVSFNPASEQNYKDGNALISLTVSGGDYSDRARHVVDEVERILSQEGFTFYMNGSAVGGTRMQQGIGNEIAVIMLISVAIVLVILFMTSKSWFEPILFLLVIGVAILLNLGTNFFLGEISYITKSIAAILQLALAMDYSIVLLHAYERQSETCDDVKQAVSNALRESFKPIICSSLTTIAGLVALMFMSFSIGLDIGLVMSKGILCSMLTVFFLMPGLILLFNRPLKKLRHKPMPLGGVKIAHAAVKARYVLPVLLVALIITGAVLQGFNTYSFTEHQPSIDDEQIQATFGNSNSMLFLVPRIREDGGEEQAADLQKQATVVDAISRIEMHGTVPFRGATTYASALADAQSSYEGELPDLIKAKLGQTFNGERYSRILVRFDFGGDIDDDTYAYIDRLHAVLGDVYGEGSCLIAGDAMSNYDISKSFHADLLVTNLITVFAIVLIIALTFRSISVPVVLVLIIQGAVWIGMSFSFITATPIFFMSYLIASAILMGATIDYGILVTNNYLKARQTMGKADSVSYALSQSMSTIFTSGLILTVAGFVVGGISTSTAISTIGMLLGRGTLVSLVLIVLLLPELLYLLDGLVRRTTMGCKGFAPPAENSKESTENR